MKKYIIKPISNIKKQISVPPDKSISHRAVIISSLCKGKTLIKPFLESDDTSRTLYCMKKLGITAKLTKGALAVTGQGMQLKPKTKKIPVELFAGESGTTMRILSGLLAAQKFPIKFEASTLLENRPMERIVSPLRKMGANINGTLRKDMCTSGEKIYPPLLIEPSKEIKGEKFELQISSAQVKSAIILAALFAKGKTIIREPYKSRDHTERMLELIGANIEVKGKTLICNPFKQLLSPKKIFI
ncbi:MAG: 3-phosphoshikimate 1-carboxyvinyltransferase, partial [Candidatus Omnitrophica bacterium]|nr:3-phosphoshikimate 1-carboxyvinyltransferase [Candidatus Omnitrophota bacterium]